MMDKRDEIVSNLTLELRRGTLILSVLSQLFVPQYGYSLIQCLNASGVQIDIGTIYPLLRRLEKQGLLESVWEVGESRPRRYYKISEDGKVVYGILCEEWFRMSKSVERLINGGEDQELIERYIYAVSRRLPVSQRADIEQELRTLIEDMIQERCHGEVGQEQIMALLKELGDPAYLAGQYREEQKYLIGPQLYDAYTLAMRIFLAASVFGISLIEIVGFFLHPDAMLEDILFQFAALLLRAVCLSFVLVTLVFALMERDHYRRASKAAWDPATLPKIPKRSQTISISGVVWSVVVSSAMISVIVMGNPTVQISEVIWITNPISIPIFSPKGMQTVAPIIVSLLFVGIIRDLVKLASGCWTMKLSVINVLINSISVICYMFFLTKPDIFNQSLVGGLALRVLWPAGVTGEAQACEIAVNVLVYLTVVALITESALSLYHGIRYQFENGQNNS